MEIINNLPIRKKENMYSQKSSFDLKESTNFFKFKEKIVEIARVTKVVKGGKILSFRVIVIVGNNLNKVGVGVGKAEDVNLAINKAILNGRKNLINVQISKEKSISRIVKSKYGASRILLHPARIGTGIIAGGSIRSVLELAGLQNVLTKQFGSKNILNNVKATILGLISLNVR